MICRGDSLCGQVRAFCIRTHCSHWLQIGFHIHNHHLYGTVSPLELNVAFCRLKRQWFSWKTSTSLKCPWLSHWILISCRTADLSGGGKPKQNSTITQIRAVSQCCYGKSATFKWSLACFVCFITFSRCLNAFLIFLIAVSYIHECFRELKYRP